MDLNNKYQNMSSDSDSKSSSLNSKVEHEESVSNDLSLFKYKLPYYHECLFKSYFTINNCFICILLIFVIFYLLNVYKMYT